MGSRRAAIADPNNVTRCALRSDLVTISALETLIVTRSEPGGEFVTFCAPSRHPIDARRPTQTLPRSRI
jgi:hypothetical protein